MPGLSGFEYRLKTPTADAIAEGTALPKISDFAEIGGFQSNSFTGNAEPIDITNKSSGENRELLNSRGVVSVEISGEGVLQDSTAHRDLQVALLKQKLRWFLVEREDGRNFIAKFKITAFNVDATHDGPQNFSITLMSSGTLYIRDSDGSAYDTGSDRITAFASQVNPFSYFLYNSARYFPSQIPARGATRDTALKAFLDGLTTPVNADKVSGTPTGNISLTGPVPTAVVDEVLTFAINTSDYKGYSRAGNYLVTGATGTLVPDIPNLLELVANDANVFATVAAANKFWLIEGAELTIGLIKHKFGEYDDANNRAKLLLQDNTEVRGDSIDVTGSGNAWSDAIDRDTLPFKWQIKNQYTFPIILLEKDVLDGKKLQVLDALDSDITSRLMFLGEKTDSTNVVWNGYYVDAPLHDNETSDIKIQIGT